MKKSVLREKLAQETEIVPKEVQEVQVEKEEKPKKKKAK